MNLHIPKNSNCLKEIYQKVESNVMNSSNILINLSFKSKPLEGRFDKSLEKSDPGGNFNRREMGVCH